MIRLHKILIIRKEKKVYERFRLYLQEWFRINNVAVTSIILFKIFSKLGLSLTIKETIITFQDVFRSQEFQRKIIKIFRAQVLLVWQRIRQFLL